MIDRELHEELRRQYNPEGSDLREMQLRLLELLKTVDGICRRNGITYWLGSGTLLGAVRHGGFIPWDDDVDIEILRKDRKRFIKACNRELPPNLHIQCNETDPEYYPNILKVRDDSTDIGEKLLLGKWGEYDIQCKYRGYFIDVFCEEPCIPKLVDVSNTILSRILALRYYKNRSAGLCRFLCKGMYLLNGVFRVISKLFADKDVLYHGFSSCFNSRRSVRYIFPTKEISFEGQVFQAPADCEGHLTEIYGNYMELPSDKLRFGHHSNVSG